MARERRRYGAKQTRRFARKVHRQVTWAPGTRQVSAQEAIPFRGLVTVPSQLFSDFVPGNLYFTQCNTDFFEVNGHTILYQVAHGYLPPQTPALYIGGTRIDQQISRNKTMNTTVPAFLIEGRYCIVFDLLMFVKQRGPR
jgi:hypothetical protein